MTSHTWLVTGGAGFIGSNFVRWVLHNRPDVRVVVFDKLTYAGSLENLKDLPGHPSDDRYVFVRGDIAGTSEVRSAFETFTPTAILNFAAESHVDRSIDGPRACGFRETSRATGNCPQAANETLGRLPFPDGRARFPSFAVTPAN